MTAGHQARSVGADLDERCGVVARRAPIIAAWVPCLRSSADSSWAASWRSGPRRPARGAGRWPSRRARVRSAMGSASRKPLCSRRRGGGLRPFPDLPPCIVRSSSIEPRTSRFDPMSMREPSPAPCNFRQARPKPSAPPEQVSSKRKLVSWSRRSSFVRIGQETKLGGNLRSGLLHRGVGGVTEQAMRWGALCSTVEPGFVQEWQEPPGRTRVFAELVRARLWCSVHSCGMR